LNFLSHYHFDKKNHSDPMFHLGLIFPDFLKFFVHQRYKPSQKKNMLPLDQGAIMHLSRDTHFHNALFFDKMCSKISAMINCTPAGNIPKTFFLAHILLEMGIDRVLMEDSLCTLDDFYSELALLNHSELLGHFEQCGMKDGAVFSEKLQNFITHKWLYQYLDNEKLPNSLQRVYIRIGIKETWKKEQNDSLVAILPQILSEIKANLPAYSSLPLH